ncbi:uncharacterized protein C16orf86 homolog [Discoglossus pictus]
MGSKHFSKLLSHVRRLPHKSHLLEGSKLKAEVSVALGLQGTLAIFLVLAHCGYLRMCEEMNEEKASRKATVVRFLNNLTSVLEDPQIKSLQWDNAAASVLVHAKLYEKEVEEQGDIMQELQNFKTFSMLHGLLCSYGFKKKKAKSSTTIHVFEHQEYKKLLMDRQDTMSDEVTDAMKSTKKSKKRKKSSTITPHGCTVASSLTTVPQNSFYVFKPQHVRPLYQYINYDYPDLNLPEEEMEGEDQTKPQDTTTEEKEANHATSSLWSHNSHILTDYNQEFPAGFTYKIDKEDTLVTQINGLETSGPVRSELDKSTQVDIDKMLSVCASHLVPPLSPQYT